MATLKFTRDMARQTFDTLSKRVPESHVDGLVEKRLAVRRQGRQLFFYFQELPTEDVIGWVGDINARIYYGVDGKRLPIGSSVDDLYNRVNLWLQKQTRSGQSQPTPQIGEPAYPTNKVNTHNKVADSKTDSGYELKVKELVNTYRKQGVSGPRLAHIVRMELMREFKGSWGQRGTVIVYRPQGESVTIETDINGL